MGLLSNTATKLALFGESLRVQLHSSSIRTNRAIMLRIRSIRSMTCFSLNKATLLWGFLITEEVKIYSELQTCGIIFAPLRLESNPTDGQTVGSSILYNKVFYLTFYRVA